MKLISEFRAGQSVIFPVVGKVTFDKNGVIEVSDKDGKAILEKNVNGVRKVGTKSASKEKSDGKKGAMEAQIEEAIANIKSIKSYDGLHKLCIDAKLPEESWKELKIPALKEYLINKISPTNSAPKEDEKSSDDLKKESDALKAEGAADVKGDDKDSKDDKAEEKKD